MSPTMLLLLSPLLVARAADPGTPPALTSMDKCFDLRFSGRRGRTVFGRNRVDAVRSAHEAGYLEVFLRQRMNQECRNLSVAELRLWVTDPDAEPTWTDSGFSFESEVLVLSEVPEGGPQRGWMGRQYRRVGTAVDWATLRESQADVAPMTEEGRYGVQVIPRLQVKKGTTTTTTWLPPTNFEVEWTDRPRASLLLTTASSAFTVTADGANPFKDLRQSLALAPVGTRLWVTPFHDVPELGFGASLNALVLDGLVGGTGEDAVEGSTTTAGTTTPGTNPGTATGEADAAEDSTSTFVPFSVHVIPVDLELPIGDGAVARPHLAFGVGASFPVEDGKLRARWSHSLSLVVPFASIGFGRKDFATDESQPATQ